MKKDKKGKDIYLQLEFADFEAGVFPTGFAFINREGDFCREADGDKQLINGFTWNRPHPPEEIGTTASGGAIYLELPEEVCAAVNREREKWFNHWAENQLAKHKAKFKKTCRGLSEGEIRTKIKAELIWVNFLLEPTIHPEPVRYEYQNTKLPERIATEYHNILTFGRDSFWEKYRTLTECQSAHPPGGSYDNSVIIAEGFIRYRDHLNKLLTEPGTTDSISETQADWTEDQTQKEIKVKTLAAIKKFEEKCASAFVLSVNVGHFCKLLETYFVEKKTPNINTTFRVNRGNKGKIGTELYRVFIESGGGNLKAQSGLFQITRSLSVFSEMDDNAIYDAIKRNAP